MPRTWTESFDFYLAEVDDSPLSIMLDLAAGEHGPLLTHAKRVLARVPFTEAREDGLPTEEVTTALAALEDRLVSAFGSSDAIYVGRTLGTGVAMFFFYAPAAAEDALFTSRAAELDETIAIRTSMDPEWGDYFEFLFPDLPSLHTILNRRLTKLLDEHGDDLSSARDLEHQASFPDHAGAASAGVALTALGYDVESPTIADGQNSWTLYFRRPDHLAEGRIDDIVMEVLDIVLPHRGEYEGWGCDLIEEITSQ
jgi:uncharacterized protein (TIGR01619 family)